MSIFKGDLRTPIPIYVTRKSADGKTGTWTMSGGPIILLMFGVLFAAILWAWIAVVEAILWIIGWFS